MARGDPLRVGTFVPRPFQKPVLRSPRMPRALLRALPPLLTLAGFGLVWHVAVAMSQPTLVPSPASVGEAIVELAERGDLFRYAVASLFRVTWGYTAAALLAIPIGILLGLSSRGEDALNPLFQILRPISPLAWIPIAILWFGVGDFSATFLIFIASFLPLVVTAMTAVHNVDRVYLDAARNFGLGKRQLIVNVTIPAAMPEILVGLRITLGVAWLVVVAAEMIAVNSGLGFLIVDARNAGNRYDLVVAGMVMIGLIGWLLDTLMRRVERIKAFQWGFSPQ